ncbi:hypothetical protein CASFOL_000916 [Castilleja foliolosa]|uniref:CCR4-NOT transcription complex subunit 11 n=1 Tax=Castilleja foliolosa TaxID=1961234 RepID=A0ABD3ELK4_9LAMI
MLGFEDAGKLLGLLKVGEEKIIEEIVKDFKSDFPGVLQFYACYALELLITSNPKEKTLTPNQRLIALAIICQGYASQPPSSNPFISTLLDAACDDKAEKYERAFVLQLLGYSSMTKSREGIGGGEIEQETVLLKQSAADYIRNFDLSSHSFPTREQLEQQYCGNTLSKHFKSYFKDHAVRNVVHDPDVPHGCNSMSSEFDAQPGLTSKIGFGNRDETVAGLISSYSLEGLTPQWIRPRPPRFPIMDGELLWLNPEINHELLWDYGMCADTIREAEVRDLIGKALRALLKQVQQEQVLVEKELANYFQDVVKNDPIAAGVLTKLVNSPEMTEYFTVLENMGMTSRSVEVVNKLTAAIELPTGFLPTYIANGIRACLAIKDRHGKKKQVKFVCGVLRNLIGDKTINVHDIFIDVQIFCIEFSRIKVAAELFHLLQSLK